MRLTLRCLLLPALLIATPVGAEHGPQPPLPSIAIRVGDVPLSVEVADEPHEREHGLMHRTELPDGHGMLFVYPGSARRVFWMRDTILSLEAAFVSTGGRVDEVVPLEPLSEVTVTSRHPARYVLEVPRGWFADHGLGTGSRLSGLPGE